MMIASDVDEGRKWGRGASSLVLGSLLAVIGARKRTDNLMKGEELDELGAKHDVERQAGEADGAYRRRLQRQIVSRGTSGD